MRFAAELATKTRHHAVHVRRSLRRRRITILPRWTSNSLPRWTSNGLPRWTSRSFGRTPSSPCGSGSISSPAAAADRRADRQRRRVARSGAARAAHHGGRLLGRRAAGRDALGRRGAAARRGSRTRRAIRSTSSPRGCRRRWPSTCESGHAVLSIYANDPDQLKDAPPELVARGAAGDARSNVRPFREHISRNQTNWAVVAAPAVAWAARVFPDVEPSQQVARLWDAISRLCRLDQPDPIAAWETHLARSRRRTDYLNRKQYTALRYRGARHRPDDRAAGRAPLGRRTARSTRRDSASRRTCRPRRCSRCRTRIA